MSGFGVRGEGGAAAAEAVGSSEKAPMCGEK